MRTRLPVLVVLAGVVLAVACAKAPYTKRKQLLLLSPGEEAKLGAAAYREQIAQEKACNDAALNKQVYAIGRSIADVSGKKEWAWEFRVLDAPDTMNAFALPGGKTAVYTGILAPAGNEAGLATVMGHEVAHAIARHGGERVSQALLVQMGLQAADLSLQDQKQRGPLMAALGLGAQVGVLMPFGRDQESEGDHIGLMLMAKAGYDPVHAVSFWQRFERTKGQGGDVPEWLSTHPSPGTRVKNLQKWLPEARKHYAKSRKLGAGAPLPKPNC